MKEICQCNCSSPTARYKTPWCDLIMQGSCCMQSYNILHLWYKLDWLRKEIDKRSSYLGKFRRTEEAKHLLDLINMTQDENDLFVPFAKAAMGDVFEVLAPYIPTHEQAVFWREGKDTAVFTDDPLPSPAVSFYKGQYVMYNGVLYVAIADGDSNDFAGKLAPTEDYRDSIHYGIVWKCKSNINAIDPLDTAIFEALVARILYKWLCLSYPDEAQRYLNEFNECLASIKERANVLKGAQILDRIPRIF